MMSVVAQSLEDPQQISQQNLWLYYILRGPIREESVVSLTAPAPLTSHNISFHRGFLLQLQVCLRKPQENFFLNK